MHRSVSVPLLLALLPALSSRAPARAGEPAGSPLRLAGIALEVPDVAEACRFYRDVLGFDEQRASAAEAGRPEDPGTPGDPGTPARVLRKQDLVLWIRQGAPGDSAEDAPQRLNFYCADLEETLRRWEEHGVALVGAPQPNAIGRSQTFLDPAGHPCHLMEIRGRAPAEPIGVFNFGIAAPELQDLLEWYCNTLGLEIFRLDYLPRTLPLQRHGMLPLVLHAEAGAEPAIACTRKLLFEATAPGFAVLRDKVHGRASQAIVTETEDALTLRDPTGLLLEVHAPVPAE